MEEQWHSWDNLIEERVCTQARRADEELDSFGCKCQGDRLHTCLSFLTCF